MHGKVCIDRLRLGGVVPVVKRRRRDHSLQRPELPSHVRVDERRLDYDDHEVKHDRTLREAEDVDWNVGQSTCHDGVNEVQPRTGEPIHPLGRVMHRVKPPK